MSAPTVLSTVLSRSASAACTLCRNCHTKLPCQSASADKDCIPGRLSNSGRSTTEYASPVWATNLGSSVLQAESLHFSQSRWRSTSSPLGPPSSALAGQTLPNKPLFSSGHVGFSCRSVAALVRPVVICHKPLFLLADCRGFSRALFYIISPSPLFRLCRCRACPLFATHRLPSTSVYAIAERSFDSSHFIPLVAALSISISLSTYSSSCASNRFCFRSAKTSAVSRTRRNLFVRHIYRHQSHCAPPLFHFAFTYRTYCASPFVPTARRPPWYCLESSTRSLIIWL